MTTLLDVSTPIVLLDIFELKGKVRARVTADTSGLLEKLVSFVYEESNKKVGQLNLTFVDPDGSLASDERFAGRDHIIEARWGYLTNLSRLRRFIMRSVENPHMQDGKRLLKVTAWSADWRGFLTSQPRNWGRRSRTEIAREIIISWGLVPDIPDNDDEKPDEDRIQGGKTSDRLFLGTLAKELGWLAHSSDGIRYYFGPDDHIRAPDFQAVYGGVDYTQVTGTPVIMKKFMPKVKLGKRPKTLNVALNTLHVKKKKRKKGVNQHASSENDAADGTKRAHLGGRLIQDFVTNTLEFQREAQRIVPGKKKNPVINKNRGKAIHWNIIKEASEATVSFVGKPEITVRRLIDVQGVGDINSGLWNITGVRHSIQVSKAVYDVTCKLKRPGKGVGKQKATKKNKKKPSEAEAEERVARIRFPDLSVTEEIQ